MGAKQSIIKKDRNIIDETNNIATEFILKQSFQDMINLRNEKYCNNLVVLTSKIINENLHMAEIEYLHEHMINGSKVDKFSKTDVLWIKPDDFKSLDSKNNVSQTKKRLCIGIAKQYIKIAHIFGAIVTTIHPTYSYKEYVNKHNKFSSNMFSNNINICSERVNALINNSNLDLGGSQTISIKPLFCDLNNQKLDTEPGIPELELLYRDVYDYKDGKYNTISNKMKRVYNNDLELFYKTFTGMSEKPSNIKKFGDIRIRDFATSDACKTDSIYRVPYKGSVKNPLFIQYAEHIKDMLRRSKKNQTLLVEILDQLFIPIPNKQTYIINHSLTDNKLDEIVSETRKLIIDCYITCENDFIKGLSIFEAIVEKQHLDVTQSQINNLEDDIYALY